MAALGLHSVRALLQGPLGQRLLGPGLLALIVKVASAGLSYIMLVVFARLLAPDAYGYYGQMLNLAVVASTLLSFGLPTAALRFWPSHVAKGEHALAAGFARDAHWILLTAGVAATVLVLALETWVLPGQRFGLRQGATLVVVMAAVMALSDFYSSLLRSQGRAGWALVPRDIVWRIGAPAAAGAAFMAWRHLEHGPAFIITIILLALVCLPQAFMVRQGMAELGTALRQRSWGRWLGPLLPLAGAGIVYAAVQQLDVVVVGTLVGANEAGAYFAAQKTASLLGLAMIAGGLVAAPLMSSAYAAGRKHELQHLCQIMAAVIAVTTLIGLALLALIGDRLLAVFNPAFVQAYPILLILGIGYSIDALAGPTAYLMQMTSLEGAYLRIMAIVYAFVLALQFTFVPRYGVVAAALASMCGVCLWNILAIALLRRKIGVDSSILSFFAPPRAG